MKTGILSTGLFLVLASLTACATDGAGKKTLSDTDRARLLVQMAAAAVAENDPTTALQNLVQAETYDSALPEIFHVRALAFNQKNDLNMAIVNAQKAIKLSPRTSDFNNTLGKLLTDANRYKDAELPLTLAADDPLYREAYKANTNLGILYYRQGKMNEAEVRFKKASQEAPALACIAHYYSGHIELSRGHFKNAQKEYDASIQKICANFAEAHLALGIAYERSKQYDKARKKFLEIGQSFPNHKVAEQALDRLKYLP